MSEPSSGWKQLLPPGPWYRRSGAYPIPAYSEFMPPPRLGRRAYGGDADPVLFAAHDPWGWQVTEYEEAFELQPGLAHLAGELLKALQKLGRGESGHGIGRLKLRHNPFWPEPLAGAGAPRHERYLALAPLALARTQDDKGRVRWTFFGASEQGPARPFWRGFWSAPGEETSATAALAFCRRLTGAGGGDDDAEPASAEAATRDLLALGFRILPGGLEDGGAWADGRDGTPWAGSSESAAGAGEGESAAATGRGKSAAARIDLDRAAGASGVESAATRSGEGAATPRTGAAAAGAGAAPGEIAFWRAAPLPSWTAPLLWREGQPLGGVRYLLTFRPFAGLPEEVRRAYLGCELHLLPFPGSLLFWGTPPYRALARELPLALQIPLLHPIERSENPHRLRVPQSGWLHEAHADQPEPATEHGPVRNSFRRTHRWQRLERHADALAVAGHEDRMAHVLFSAAADDLGLYGKPMARNAQIWTQGYHLLLDGPRAGRAQVTAAARRVAEGGTFGYRFLYPAMRVGDHEVYWHRLLAALPGAGGQAEMIPGAPLGVLTAYHAEHPDLSHPVELWPRLLARPAHRAAIEDPRGGTFAAAPADAAAAGAAAEAEADAAAADAAGLEGPSGGKRRGGGARGAKAAAYRRTVNNARKLLDAWQLLGGRPLPESFARALVRLAKDETLAAWLDAVEQAGRSAPGGGGPRLAVELRALLAAPEAEAPAAEAPAAAPPNGGGEPPAAEVEESAELGQPAPPEESGGVAAAKPAEVTAEAPAAAAALAMSSGLGAIPAAAEGSGPAPPAGTAAAGSAPPASEEPPLTFAHTAHRHFEEAYWRRIAFLAEGRFVNKDNADVVRDPVTLSQLPHRHRDLDDLAEHLLAYYRKLIAAHGMEGRAAAGDLPFRWHTDFDFSWSGGWLGNQQGHLEERNLLVAIPGRDRGRAVIMADHYDTAYMEDRYGYQHGGHGPRLAAAGADDNHSATVALMLAAPIFLDLSRAGQLGCDVWLVHLTGEEFPSDCLGARHLTESLVEGTLRLRTRPPSAAAALAPAVPGEVAGWLDLSETRVQGVYVLDMVAHNNDRERDVFQVCPGAGGESMWLALQAHLANRAWNRLAPGWNRRGRRGCKRGRRSADGQTMPALALHPRLRGEVRPQIDPHSTLYNTDGQIFSDAGVPVVLFMENYDINRHGYHDSHDTMENIDLDYGAAVAAIAIETVARAATQPPPRFD